MNYNTISNKKLIKALYREGKRIVTRQVVILYRKKSDITENKVLFVVSKKVGNAVIRNKIRRRLKEILRNYCGKSDLKYDYIIIARSRILGYSFHELEKVITKVLCEG
jgi:ribonuclease P protein component